MAEQVAQRTLDEIKAEVLAKVREEVYLKYKTSKASWASVPYDMRGKLEDAYVRQTYPDVFAEEESNNAQRVVLATEQKEIRELREQLREREVVLSQKREALAKKEAAIRTQVALKRREVYNGLFDGLEQERKKRRKAT